MTGYVPDIRAHIAAAAVYVVPLRMGGGTRLKVLEAMAMRSAIVSTRLGCEGFPLEGHQVVAFADEPAAFANTVIGPLARSGPAPAMGEAGRRFVESHYGWGAIVPKLKAVYRSWACRME